MTKVNFSITIALLVGIIMGLLLSGGSSVVAVAPGQPLKEVSHDATLTGDGTISAPLSIANGGVGVNKLATAASPTRGQVLTFNGTGLSWESASSSNQHSQQIRVSL